MRLRIYAAGMKLLEVSTKGLAVIGWGVVGGPDRGQIVVRHAGEPA